MIYFKRCFSLFLCFILLLYICTNVYIYSYADNIDKNLFDKIYEGYDFSDTIAKHGSFSFLDKVNNKHSVYYGNGTWVCLFGRKETFNDDSALNYYLSYYAYKGYSEVSNLFGAYLSNKIGYASKEYTALENAMASDITNVANNISYDVNNDTITFDSSSVDKLREEIKLQYYRDNGMFYIGGSLNKPTDIIKSSWYDDMTLYQEDYNLVSNYDFAIGGNQNAFYFNSSDYAYIYLYLKSDSYFGSGSPSSNASVWWQFTDNDLNPITLPNYTKSLNCTDSMSFKEYNMVYNEYAFRFYTRYSSNVRGNYSELLLNNIKSRVCIDTASTSYGINPCVQWKTENLTDNSYYDYISSAYFYAKPNKTFVGFTSYEALFNYVHGESSCYLGSTINKVGEDITFSIKDMNESLGSKMDTLIDTINDKKGSMSADELQNAIDKGLEDLNKTTEDIKDNVEETNNKLDGIIEILQEQNQTLLDILGITKKIYDNTEDIKKDADFNNVVSSINVIFNAVQCALLYGKNTLKDDNGTSAQSVEYANNVAVFSSDTTYKPKILQMDLRSGIFGHFPFSMMYHMYDWCAAFVAEEKAPVFTYNYGFLLGDKDNPDFTVSIDLSQYESWRDVAASFLKLSMTLAVAYGSYKRFKEEIL